MTCQEVVELVTAYLEGALEPHLVDGVALHLDSCTDCDTYVDELRWTIELLGALPPQPPPPQVRARLQDAFRAWSAGR